mgnify:CR=1 FL=1
MTVRFAALLAFVAAMILGLASATSPSQAAEKAVTIKPSSGIVGTVVEAKLTGAPANDPITVIFKIPGDPILTTGTTDANGVATFTFTIPYALSGTYPIFFTDFKCSCQIATDFTVIVGQRTPTPTPTPTTPPTATPTITATPPTPATATPTSTPQVPVAGTTQPLGPGGPNVGILGLGFLVVITVVAWFSATRRNGPGTLALAGGPFDDVPDYSTDLDARELMLDGEPMRPFRPVDEPGRVTRVVEAAAGTLDAFGLLFRRK